MLVQTIAQRARLPVPRSTEIEVLAAAVLVFAGFSIAIATGFRYPVALIIVSVLCSLNLLRWMLRLDASAHASRALTLFGICFCIGIAAAHAIDLADVLTPRTGEGYLVAAVAIALPGAVWLTYILRRSQTLPHVWAWTMVVPITWLAFGLPGLDFRFVGDDWWTAARWHSSVSEELSPIAMAILLFAQRRVRSRAPLSVQAVLLFGVAMAGWALVYRWADGNAAALESCLPAIAFGLCALPLVLLLWRSGRKSLRCFDIRGLPAGLAGCCIAVMVAVPEGLDAVVPMSLALAAIVFIFAIAAWMRSTPAGKSWGRAYLRLNGHIAGAAVVGLLLPQFLMYVGLATEDATAADSLERIESHWSIVPVALYERALMNDEYLWADSAPPPVVVEKFGLPNEVADLPWSAVMSREEAKADDSRTRRGFGFVLPERRGSEGIVAYAFPGSSAQRAGIRRGDRIVGLNGKLGAGETLLDAFARAREVRGPVTFEVQTRTGEKRMLMLERKQYRRDSVLLQRVLPGNDAPVGYLALYDFDGSIGEINQVLKSFRRDGVRDLVLDLRWNPGGAVHLASKLVQALAGPHTPADGPVRMRYSTRNRDLDEDEEVWRQADATLRVRRLAVITTARTCSASEAVIAGLRPYVELFTVGSTTCGKPVGGRRRVFGDRSYYVISFQAFMPGELGYFHGIAPDCPAEDDLRHDLGDPEESSLKVALQALRDGGCGGTAAAVASH